MNIIPPHPICLFEAHDIFVDLLPYLVQSDALKEGLRTSENNGSEDFSPQRKLRLNKRDGVSRKDL